MLHIYVRARAIIQSYIYVLQLAIQSFYILYKFRANVAMQSCFLQAAPERGIDLFKNDQRDRMQQAERILFMSKCFVLFACECVYALP